ncbi:MAG TPA: hypothetical protein VFR23_26140 [Jiangellaceae bacterium]|nr:hypothetical protein [Jiangellaceae bacterium]
MIDKARARWNELPEAQRPPLDVWLLAWFDGASDALGRELRALEMRWASEEAGRPDGPIGREVRELRKRHADVVSRCVALMKLAGIR